MGGAGVGDDCFCIGGSLDGGGGGGLTGCPDCMVLSGQSRLAEVHF